MPAAPRSGVRLIAAAPAAAARRLSPLDASGALFGLRATAATLAALWLAMQLQFETPRWAAWTVMSLSLPTHGLVATKGAWRAGGTVLGLVAGMAGVALLAQSPVAMGLFLAAWCAFCAWCGGRFSGNAAYGAALAALTASLLVILSAPDPLSAFSVATARGADIFLGVACAYVASALSEFLSAQQPANVAAGPRPGPAEVAAGGVRAFVAVALSWALWLATAWTDGGVFVVFVAVIVVVFGAAPDADRRTPAYLRGVAIGQGLGLFVKFVLLAAPTSFPMLAATLAPFIFVGAAGMKDPRSADTAIGFNLSFLLAADPANPMQFDPVASINETFAIFAGVAGGIAAYRFILPRLVWRSAP
ncbi:FUSC family protein [Methylocella sp.]|uniref:FUSC family protein n=1 Tax=Methylocella sp. TaxID=1978226 RepID=UPI003784FF21